MMVFDTDFLPAPPGPAPEAPSEPEVPLWVVVAPEDEAPPSVPPPIPVPELPL